MILSITSTQIVIQSRLGNGFLDIDIPDTVYFKLTKEYLETAGFIFYEDRRNILHVNMNENRNLEIELCGAIIKAILMPNVLQNTIKQLHEIKYKLDTETNI